MKTQKSRSIERPTTCHLKSKSTRFYLTSHALPVGQFRLLWLRLYPEVDPVPTTEILKSCPVANLTNCVARMNRILKKYGYCVDLRDQELLLVDLWGAAG
ncbi:MAG: hypothetical protein MI864_15945 [Pseudomonadales bacterium]|nr:hypothetical protein [Pseudomonadales bacterium]